MNVEDLVNSLQKLAADYREDLKQGVQTREPFNLFTTLLPHDDEVWLHTRFLHFLLDPAGPHGCGDHFLQSFFRRLSRNPPIAHDGSKMDVPDFPSSEWSVQRDVVCANYGNLDLLLSRPDFAIVIENKTRLYEQPRQLERYADYLQAKHQGQCLLLFLTPLGATSTTAEGKKYHRISYAGHILPWLEECLANSFRNEVLPPIIRQYCDVVKELVGQTPKSTAMDQLVEKICRHGELIRHREALKEALDQAHTYVLGRLAKNIRLELADYTISSPPGREFESRSEGILEIMPSGNLWIEAPFRICLQNWSGNSLLILGLECTDLQAIDHALLFAQMKPTLLQIGFSKSGAYSTWPLGWVTLVTGFNDEKLASYVEGTQDELQTPLMEKIKRSLGAIETAYRAAKSPRDYSPGI